MVLRKHLPQAVKMRWTIISVSSGRLSTDNVFDLLEMVNQQKKEFKKEVEKKRRDLKMM